MTDIYAMQRANGDWFAFDEHGGFRVPVFRGKSAAMQARAFNAEMLLFKPVLLDERRLKDLAPAKGVNTAYFWLVDNPSVNLKGGQRIEHAQLALLAREPAELPTASPDGIRSDITVR
jgi:hypothetical protein